MWNEGVGSCSRLCAEPSPHCICHPSPPQYHRQMTARQTHIQNAESGINHPANEESLFYILTGIVEWSIASRWDSIIQHDSRERQRKTVLVRPAASTFHFQETGYGLCENVRSPGARGAGSQGAEDAAGDAAVGWIIFSESNPITSKEGVVNDRSPC